MFSVIKFFSRFLVVGFLLFNVSNAFSQANANFYAARAYDGGVGSATGDFNRDGNLDIVSVKPDRINLLSGNGSGFFNQPPTTIFNCGRFSSTALSQPVSGDFNGDGKLDVAAFIGDDACGGTGLRSLMLLPGNGGGGFSAPVFTTVSNFFFTPDQFLTADFNGDGRPDVAVGSSFSTTDGDKVGIFLSSGSGGFAEPVVYNLGGQAFYGLTVGDFNNDNRADLVYSLRSPMNLAILPNIGNGTFGAPQIISSSVSERGIAAGDFNNDGKLDFTTVQGNSPTQTIRVWFGNGNNTFTAGQITSVSSIDFGITNILPGDYNRDGRLDVALIMVGQILIFDGGGSGTFIENERYNVGGGKIIKGDFDNDGWTDLATQQTLGFQGSASGVSSELAVLLNLRDGKFLTAPYLQIPVGGEEIAVADFNNDGLKDIAITGDASTGEILLILQDPNARSNNSVRHSKFESAARISARGSSLTPRTIAAGDFNGDGKNDVVVAGRAIPGATENVIVALNDGAGNLTLSATLSLGALVTKVITGDFNGDGILDLAFSQNRETAPNTIPSVLVAFGTGGGAFVAPVGYLTSVVGVSLTKGDFNGDGKPDLAVAQNNAKITVLLNNGTGGLVVGASYDLPANPTEIVAADLNGDGKQDLIVANNVSFISETAGISVFNGIGNGTFAALVNYKTTGLSDQRLTVDDFNGDGKPDVAVTNNGVNTLLENDGGGTLTRKTFWASGGGLRDIASADFDGDQKTDLITTSSISNFSSLTFLPNITSPAVVRQAKFDFDGDGKADVSVFRPSNGAWYLQQSQAGFTGIAFGLSSDKLVPADYDGDGKTDVAVYRSGTWYLQRSQLGFTGITFGAADDIPVPADYDGDGKADLAVFRPSNGVWYLQRSSLGFAGIAFGQTGDKPVPADYDGDGKADIAVNRNGIWYIQRSQLGFTGIAFGDGNDKLVPADYDGDGKADVAVFRPGNGTWYLQQSTAGFTGIAFGVGTDLPAAADYDGDGKADLAVFRNGTWYLNRTTAGFTGVAFGASTDKPIPNAFVQ